MTNRQTDKQTNRQTDKLTRAPLQVPDTESGVFERLHAGSGQAGTEELHYVY